MPVTLLILLVVALSAAVSDVLASRSAVAPPTGVIWTSQTRSVRGEIGSQFVFVCPADSRILGTAWGTDVYADSSSVCTAAVHQGLITVADGGLVTVEVRPGLSSYTGSSRNGVTTSSYPKWDGSFVVVEGRAGGGTPGVKMGGGDWRATAALDRGRNGERYSYLCPSGGFSTSIWGTGTYRDDSTVCGAAVHAGAITTAGGGNVTIEMRPGESSYASSAANGVTSTAFGSSAGSFVVVGAPAGPGSGGGGGGGGGGSTTTGSAVPPATGTATGTVIVGGKPFTGGAIPYKSTVDVTRGALQLRTDTGTLSVSGAGGRPALFTLLRGTDNKRPIVELRLKGGDFGACPKRGKRSTSQAAPTNVVRQLWGNGNGKFRTRGRYAAATVRGTSWLTADRCDGTLVRVTQGRVQVNDLGKRSQVTVPAGRTYLARP